MCYITGIHIFVLYAKKTIHFDWYLNILIFLIHHSSLMDIKRSFDKVDKYRPTYLCLILYSHFNDFSLI